MTTTGSDAQAADAGAPQPGARPRRTLASLALDAAERHRGVALRYPDGDVWRTLTYADFGTAVREIGAGLIALGVAPGDRVAILSNTRVEWTLADFGVACAGAAVVPVYQTNSPEECRYVLEHSGARAIFCEDPDQAAKIAAVRDSLPALRHVVLFEGAADGATSLAQLRERGREAGTAAVDERVAAIAEDDVATIVYTSGTTGPPKGCMIAHRNLRATVEMIERRLSVTPGRDVVYIFLPLAHVLTRIVQEFTISGGGEIAYWRRDTKLVIDDVALIRPTHLPSVPRVFEKIRTAARAKAEEAGPIKRRLFEWAVAVGTEARRRERGGEALGRGLKLQRALADRLVLGRIRALFGGRVELAITGGAPIDEELLAFFDAAGVVLLEGYGMTETSAVATLNTPAEHKLGTVGRPLPGVEVRIDEEGELLMRGPNVFAGYFRDEEATRATFDGDWLRTGDLGEVDDDGYVRITGRKKDLIITSSGKNVTPSNIESALTQSRWIANAVVYGDRRQYLTALLTLDPEQAAALADRVGAGDADPAALAVHDGVRRELQAAVDEANARFARIEQVKRFDVLERDLSQEEGELTPSLKVKRNVVYERYADRFAALYGDG